MYYDRFIISVYPRAFLIHLILLKVATTSFEVGRISRTKMLLCFDRDSFLSNKRDSMRRLFQIYSRHYKDDLTLIRFFF